MRKQFKLSINILFAVGAIECLGTFVDGTMIGKTVADGFFGEGPRGLVLSGASSKSPAQLCSRGPRHKLISYLMGFHLGKSSGSPLLAAFSLSSILREN